MNGATDALSVEMQSRLERYLNAVEQALTQSRMPRSERRCVVDEVESQVRDMLLTRTAGSPTLEELESVLAEMDPPRAYAVASDTSINEGGDFEYVLRPKTWLGVAAAMVIPVLAAAFTLWPPAFAWVVICLVLVYAGSAFVQSYVNTGHHDRVVLGVLMMLCPTLMVISCVIAVAQMIVSHPLAYGYEQSMDAMDIKFSTWQLFAPMLIQYGVWIMLALLTGAAVVYWTARWLSPRSTPPGWVGVYRTALRSPMLPHAIILIGWAIAPLITMMRFSIFTEQARAWFLVGWLGTTLTIALLLGLIHMASRSGRVAAGLAAASLLLVVVGQMSM